MDKLIERVENNFINIYKKFDKINKIFDIIISNEYTKIYKTYYPMKNYDLSQDRFFIYSENIDIPLKKNAFIIFEYIFQAEYIDIPLVINLKIDNVLEKDFHLNLKNITKLDICLN